MGGKTHNRGTAQRDKVRQGLAPSPPVGCDAADATAKLVPPLSTTSASENVLASDLEDLASEEKWTFRPWAEREYSHGLFQYPAMMVPQMQRELLQRLQREIGGRVVYDPFVGSGTSMAEAMLQGLDFIGADINPLAVLLCRAKSGPFFIEALEDAHLRVSGRAMSDRGLVIEAKFPGWQKWFRKDVAISLSRIARAIRRERLLSTRRFLWVALAETVRLTSNSRTSTVKLHVRPEDEVRVRNLNVLGIFHEIADVNLSRFADQRDALNGAALLSRGHYSGVVSIHLHDVSTELPTAVASDILLTSPRTATTSRRSPTASIPSFLSSGLTSLTLTHRQIVRSWHPLTQSTQCL